MGGRGELWRLLALVQQLHPRPEGETQHVEHDVAPFLSGHVSQTIDERAGRRGKLLIGQLVPPASLLAMTLRSDFRQCLCTCKVSMVCGSSVSSQ